MVMLFLLLFKRECAKVGLTLLPNMEVPQVAFTQVDFEILHMLFVLVPTCGFLPLENASG